MRKGRHTILTGITSAKTPFLNQSHSEVLGRHEFGATLFILLHMVSFLGTETMYSDSN